MPKGQPASGKRITGEPSVLLNEYVKECMTFGLNDNDSLVYINIKKLGTVLDNTEISIPIIWERRKQLNSEDQGRTWLNHFAKIGFVLEHQQSITNVKMLIKMANKELFDEQNKPISAEYADPETGETKELKPDQVRDPKKLKELRADLRDSLRLLDDLMRGSPALMEVASTAEQLKRLNDKLNKYGISDIDEFARKLQRLPEGSNFLPEAFG